MNEEILKEIPLHKIPFLLETFKRNPSRFYPLTQYITIYKEYKDGNIEEPRQTLFSYGNVEEGVYVLESIFPNKGTPYNNFFIYTAAEDLSELKSVLSQTSHIPWYKRGYSIQVVSKNIAPVIREVARSKGVELTWVEEIMMWLPPDKSPAAGDIPEEMELKYLNSTHVQEISQNWPHKFPGCEFYLEQQIRNNFGLGLFRKTDNKMVSSALSFHSGGIFVLFTHPEYRGNGSAAIIVQNMAKELLQRGRIPFALVRKENIPSQKLFKKVGFHVLAEVEHIFPKTFRS